VLDSWEGYGTNLNVICPDVWVHMWENVVTRMHVKTLHEQQTSHIYKTILKPVWTCGIQLYDMATTSNIEILECFQSKALRMIVDEPRYMPNTVIQRDLQIPTVKEGICRYSSQYSARLSVHPHSVVNLMEEPDSNRQLRRHLPNDLPTRFLV
jgi:hypothetical protein